MDAGNGSSGSSSGAHSGSSGSSSGAGGGSGSGAGSGSSGSSSGSSNSGSSGSSGSAPDAGQDAAYGDAAVDSPVEASPPDAAQDAGLDASDGGGASDSGADAGDAASGDGGIGFACSGASPSLKNTIYPRILSGCGGERCHGGTLLGAWGGAANVHAALVNAPMSRNTCKAGVLVSPGSLQNSYVMNKLTGVGVCPGSARMPLLGALPPADIQAVADWICSGALNN
ncbi:MAG: hypothetical protein M3O50_19220 [Myxococcota bacterium]|nr:hypothetical protein [Myxococcota bacterium]